MTDSAERPEREAWEVECRAAYEAEFYAGMSHPSEWSKETTEAAEWCWRLFKQGWQAARRAPAAGAPEWMPLTDEDRQAAFESLPDMLEGFMKKWGWLHFAKEIERRCREKNAAAQDGWKLVPVEPTEAMVTAIIARRWDWADIASGRRSYPEYETRQTYRAMLAAAPAAPKEKCWCHTCRPITMEDSRMILCPTCGNKRCPKANDHRNACTGSNEAGQPGSAYPKQEKA